jgi:hypothetical protein
MKRLFLPTLLLTMFISHPVIAAMSPEKVAAQLAAARALHAEAKASHHSWTVTTRLMTKAELALKVGNLKEAEMLVSQAYKTAAASVAQMYLERDMWEQRVPGNVSR